MPYQSSLDHYFSTLPFCFMRKIFIGNIFILSVKINTIFLTIYRDLFRFHLEKLQSQSFEDSKKFKGDTCKQYSSFYFAIIHVRYIVFSGVELLYTFSFNYATYRRLWDFQLFRNFPWIHMMSQFSVIPRKEKATTRLQKEIFWCQSINTENHMHFSIKAYNFLKMSNCIARLSKMI